MRSHLAFGPSDAQVRVHRDRRALLGRLMAARKLLNTPEAAKPLKAVNAAIRQTEAQLRQSQKALGPLGGTSPLPVDAMVYLDGPDTDVPLYIAYGLLSVARLPSLEGRDIGLINACRDSCRGACIKAGLTDPRQL